MKFLQELQALYEDDFGDAGQDPQSTQQPEETEKEEPKIIGKADQYRVELDSDEQVHVLDGEGNIKLSMPLVIWKQLTRG